MVVHEPDIDQRAGTGVTGHGIDGVAAADEQIVLDQHVGVGAPVAGDHQRRGLGVVVDDGVVPDGDIAGVDVDPVIVGAVGAEQVVDVVALDEGIVAHDIQAIHDALDVVPQERTLAQDTLR